jgi:hypothetical protein
MVQLVRYLNNFKPLPKFCIYEYNTARFGYMARCNVITIFLIKHKSEFGIKVSLQKPSQHIITAFSNHKIIMLNSFFC